MNSIATNFAKKKPNRDGLAFIIRCLGFIYKALTVPNPDNTITKFVNLHHMHALLLLHVLKILSSVGCF